MAFTNPVLAGVICATALPFAGTSIDVMWAVVYNPGIKENAGIFNQTQGWGVMAACILEDGELVYRGALT